jgi:prostaglandin-E synthase 1
MSAWSKSPSFIVYSFTAIVLCLNLLVVWAYSGVVRGKLKSAINPEDQARFGGSLGNVEPPEVARVLRAHANAQATIYPLLILGPVFVLAGASLLLEEAIFGVFVAARLLHALFYLTARQPWRTASFVVSGLAILVLMGAIVWLVL